MSNNRMAIYLSVIMAVVVLVSIPMPSVAWSNGGYTSETEFNNDEVAIGTHDFIAGTSLNLITDSDDFSLNWLLNDDDALRGFLYGTEFPDNPSPYGFYSDEFGDTTKHHIYYDKNTLRLSDCYDDSAAIRAQECYENALKFYEQGDHYKAGIYLGMMTHYISDVAVFGHVMGSSTPWGSEDSYDHSAFEKKADTHIQNAFPTYISMIKYIKDEADSGVDYSQMTDIMLYVNTMTPIYKQSIEYTFSDVANESGGIAPYYIALQVARVNTFGFLLENYTPSESADPHTVFNESSVAVFTTSGQEYYTFPAPYIAYNFDTIDLEIAVASAIALGIAGVEIALEQFPNEPTYTTISGEDSGGGSLIGDQTSEDIQQLARDLCCITPAIVVLFMVTPLVVVDATLKRRK